MGYRLGIDLGTGFTAAAVVRDGAAAESVTLGASSPHTPSAVFFDRDGGVHFGDAALSRAATEHDRAARRFVARIGDATPLLLGNAGERVEVFAHDLAAAMVAWVVANVTTAEGEAPESIALTHPATWGPYKKSLVRDALAAQGLDAVTFVGAAQAAAIGYAQTGRLAADATVAVYDLGHGFDVAVLRRTDADSFTSLHAAAQIADFGGADLDDAVLTHVLHVVREQDPTLFTTGDDADLEALAALRAGCVTAKERLSTQDSVALTVMGDAGAIEVELTRTALEALVADRIEATVQTFCQVVADADLDGGLDAVLLAGGGSQVPLVMTALMARLDEGVQILRVVDPKACVAAGAALAAPRVAAAVPAARVSQNFGAPVDLAEPTTPAEPAPAAQAPASKAPAAKTSAAKAPTAKTSAAKTSTRRNLSGIAAAVSSALGSAATESVSRPAPKAAGTAVATAVAERPAAPEPAALKPAATTAGAVEAAPRPVALTDAAGRPIRSRRGSARAVMVGLDGNLPAAADPADGRPVIKARAVRSVDQLLIPPVKPAGQLPPPRPALSEDDLLDAADEDYAFEPFTWRSVVTIRRGLAVAAMTAAIFVGATAWNPATPPKVEKPAASAELAKDTKPAKRAAATTD